MNVCPLPVPIRGFLYAYMPAGVEEVATLLCSGRANAALQLLERLPARIEAERREAVAEAEAAHKAALAEADARMAELQREVQRLHRELAQARATFSGKAAALAEALSDGRITVARVAQLLKVRPADVEAIADGRVGLSSGRWCRVLAEVEA